MSRYEEILERTKEELEPELTPSDIEALAEIAVAEWVAAESEEWNLYVICHGCEARYTEATWILLAPRRPRAWRNDHEFLIEYRACRYCQKDLRVSEDRLFNRHGVAHVLTAVATGTEYCRRCSVSLEPGDMMVTRHTVTGALCPGRFCSERCERLG